MTQVQKENRYVFQFVNILDKALYDRYIKNDTTLERYIVYNDGKLDLQRTIGNICSHVDYWSMEEWVNSIDFDFACEELRKMVDEIDESILENNWEKAMTIQLLIAESSDENMRK